jgi:hypothetical protein
MNRYISTTSPWMVRQERNLGTVLSAVCLTTCYSRDEYHIRRPVLLTVLCDLRNTTLSSRTTQRTHRGRQARVPYCTIEDGTASTAFCSTSSSALSSTSSQEPLPDRPRGKQVENSANGLHIESPFLRSNAIQSINARNPVPCCPPLSWLPLSFPLLPEPPFLPPHYRTCMPLHRSAVQYYLIMLGLRSVRPSISPNPWRFGNSSVTHMCAVQYVIKLENLSESGPSSTLSN